MQSREGCKFYSSLQQRVCLCVCVCMSVFLCEYFWTTRMLVLRAYKIINAEQRCGRRDALVFEQSCTMCVVDTSPCCQSAFIAQVLCRLVHRPKFLGNSMNARLDTKISQKSCGSIAKLAFSAMCITKSLPKNDKTPLIKVNFNSHWCITMHHLFSTFAVRWTKL